MFDLTPFKRGQNDIFSVFDDMEKNFFQNFSRQLSTFKTDIVDKGDKYVLEVDIPGFNKDDIDIRIENNSLIISAKQNMEKEENKDNCIRKERRYGSYTRSFDVTNIKTEEIKADYKNGVLSLELPKKDGNDPNIRKIDIH